MLVLSRKVKEEILIGEDIKVTLIRVRGNTVRIGIEAPRETRIRRAELEPLDCEIMPSDDNDECVLSPREQAFAHPEAVVTPDRDPQVRTNRITPNASSGTSRSPEKPQLYVGTVKRSGKDPSVTRAPLAEFITAT